MRGSRAWPTGTPRTSWSPAPAITGAGAVLGLLVGAVSGGDGGLWAFIGMGAGALIAIAVLSVRVFRNL